MSAPRESPKNSLRLFFSKKTAARVKKTADPTDLLQVRPHLQEDPVKRIKLPTLGHTRTPSEPGAHHVAAKLARVGQPGLRTQAIRQRLVLGGIVVCLLSGPVSCMSRQAASSVEEPVTQTASDTAVQSQVEASAVAFVRQWMVTSRETAAQLYAQMVREPERATWPQKPAKAAELVEAVASTPMAGEPSSWIVTVHAIGGGAGVGEWYTVPVQASQQDQVWKTGILALPGRAAAPATLGAGSDSVRLQPLSANEPAVVTAFGFVNAWLTSAPNVDRWTTPGFKPPAVSGERCTSVRLDHAGASTQDAQLLTDLSNPVRGALEEPSASATPAPASAAATPVSVTLRLVTTCVTASAARPGEYSVRLSQNSGQWAVQSIT